MLASKTPRVAPHATLLFVLLCASDAQLLLKAVRSGAHLTHARFSEAPSATDGPLSLGPETVPLGAAFLFGHRYPDLFVANTAESEHPGVFAYEFAGLAPSSAPTFRKRFRVEHPFAELLPRGAASIVQVGATVHGFWHVAGAVFAHAVYAPDRQGFLGRRELRVTGLPEGAVVALAFAPAGHDASAGELLIEVALLAPPEASAEQVVANGGYRDPSYNPGDSAPGHAPRSAAGVWTPGAVESEVFAARVTLRGEDGAAAARRQQRPEARMPYGHLSIAELLVNASGALERGVIAGSVTGMLYMLPRTGGALSELRMRVHLKNPDGELLQHRYPRARPIVYADASGAPHLIVGGVGPLQFYRFHELSMDVGGVPTYQPGRDVLEADGELHAGARAVVSSADWDGDGRTDIVSGTADGRVLLLRNVGTNEMPAFMPGVPLTVGGQELRLQGGYMAVEGPAESSFGYANPTVFDWDGDGRADLLCVGPLGEVLLYFNLGSEQMPLLMAGRRLLLDGFELRSMWQVKPGAVSLHGRTLLVLLDDANELHAYYGTGSLHVRDAGKLRLLQSGRPIRASTLGGGAAGQLSLDVVDFDGDGTLDVVMGAPRHASVPDGERGLPRSQGLPGAVVLLLRGRVEEQGRLPRFHHPSAFLHNGSVILTGRAKGSVCTVTLSSRGGLHLLVADDSGRVAIFERALLSTADAPRFARRDAELAGDDAVEASSLQDAISVQAHFLRGGPTLAGVWARGDWGGDDGGADAGGGGMRAVSGLVPALQGFSVTVGACSCFALILCCRTLWRARRAGAVAHRRRVEKSHL